MNEGGKEDGRGREEKRKRRGKEGKIDWGRNRRGREEYSIRYNNI